MQIGEIILENIPKIIKFLKNFIPSIYIGEKKVKNLTKIVKKFKKILNYWFFYIHRRNKNRKCDKNHKFFYKFLKNKEIAIQ